MGKHTTLTEKLIRIARLEDDEGYERTTDAAIAKAMLVLHAAEDAGFPPNIVVPTVNGGISLDWWRRSQRGSDDAHLHCREDGSFDALLFEGHHIVERWQPADDELGAAVERIKGFIEGGDDG